MHLRVNVVKSVSSNLRVSSLEKPMFIYVYFVRSLNVSNAVKSFSATHQVCRVTHDVTTDRLSIRKQIPFLLLALNLLPHI